MMRRQVVRTINHSYEILQKLPPHMTFYFILKESICMILLYFIYHLICKQRIFFYLLVAKKTFKKYLFVFVQYYF